MRIISLITLLFIAFSSLHSQVDNPIPESISPSGLIIKLQDFTTIPKSSNAVPRARINLLREAPDNSGRLFVNDLRGEFWVIEGNSPSLFINLDEVFPNFINAPGKGTGFGAFAFHPEFATNGLFYTTHTESTGSAPADYSPLEFDQIAMQWILTEWKCDAPSANTFVGTRQEILRFDYPGIFHGMQEITFNPNAQNGETDFGMLYICLGDGASSLNLQDENLQSTHSFMGTIFRINPLGNNSPNGEYGIPSGNPFANTTDPDVLKEIYAYGFRNPHRISWDTEGSQLMLEGDIGEKNIEELNIILPGKNYGWNQREGTFLFDNTLGQDFVFNLPSDDSLNNYTYPVAMYDHDEGPAIVGGYVYRGVEFPELYGQYLFGDIVNGKLFHVPVDSLQLGKSAEIFSVEVRGNDGTVTTLLSEVQQDRADLRFGKDNEGEIYVLTKIDGVIRKVVHPDAVSVFSPKKAEEANWLSPNPSDGRFIFSKNNNENTKSHIQVFDSVGKKVFEKETLQNEDTINLTYLPKGIYWVHFFNKNQVYLQQVVIQ